MNFAFRTPEDRFEGLPDFPWRPKFRQWDGLRLAHLDEGSGPPVLLVHGEPTWSFLWRKVMQPLLDSGYRCIVPDLPGFGRSDKPVDLNWYSYDRHAAALAALVEELDLRKATVVVHDWGGPIGLRVAVEHSGCFDRLVTMNTGLLTGRQRMSVAWQRFRAFVEQTEDLPIGSLVRGACYSDPGEDVIAAYDAPFPSVESKAAARAFPLLVPLTPVAPGAVVGQRVLEALQQDDRPTLMFWGESDPMLPVSVGERFAAAIGREPPRLVPEASHFLQEDQGEWIGLQIAEWLDA